MYLSFSLCSFLFLPLPFPLPLFLFFLFLLFFSPASSSSPSLPYIASPFTFLFPHPSPLTPTASSSPHSIPTHLMERRSLRAQPRVFDAILAVVEDLAIHLLVSVITIFLGSACKVGVEQQDREAVGFLLLFLSFFCVVVLVLDEGVAEGSLAGLRGGFFDDVVLEEEVRGQVRSSGGL